jgi:hypothetical protein
VLYANSDNTDRHSEIEGFFNLLYSHLFALYPADSPDTTRYLTALLQTISSSSSEQATIKYRMYDSYLLYLCHPYSHINLFLDCPTSLTLSHGCLLCGCWCIKHSCELHVLITN